MSVIPLIGCVCAGLGVVVSIAQGNNYAAGWAAQACVWSFLLYREEARKA